MCPCTSDEQVRDANFRSQQNNYIVFCPSYYNDLSSLHEALNEHDSLPEEDFHAVNDFPETQGAVYFHESLVRSQA